MTAPGAAGAAPPPRRHRPLRRFLEHWRRLEIGLACALLATLVALILVQVVLRATLGALTWAEEAGAYLFLWIIFLGAAGAYKRFHHIRVGLVDALGETGRRLGPVFGNGVAVAVAVLLLGFAPQVLRLEWGSSTTSLPIDLPRALFYSVPLIYCLASIAVTGLCFLVIGTPADESPDQAIA